MKRHYRHKRKESGLQRNPLFLYTRVCTRSLLPCSAEHAEAGFVTAASVTNLTKLYPACGGSSCIATERSPERRRRARLPLSGTALLQRQNVPHPSGNPGTYPTAALWSGLLRCGRLCRLSRAKARISRPARLSRASARTAHTPRTPPAHMR